MNRIPDARQVELFLLVADTLHFGRAAVRAGIAQPALSLQIRRLEQALGFRVFNRTSRRVTLSAEGEAFRLSAQRGLAALREGVLAGRLIASGYAGRLVVGYSGTAMLMQLPRVLRAFSRDHPRIDLELREVASAPQLQLLTDGALDAAFVATDAPITTSAIRTAAVWPDDIMLAVPKDHPGAGRQVVDPRLPLRHELGPLVLFPRDQAPAIHDGLMSLWRQLGGTPDVAQRAQTWHMIVSLVAAGMGSSLVPAAVKRLRVPGVRFIGMRPAPLQIGVALCVRQADDRRLVSALTEHAVR